MPSKRPAAKAATTGTRDIVIRNLTLPISIGYYGHEKGRVQPVQINLVLAVLDTPVIEGNLSSVVDYVSIVSEIRKLSRRRHIFLVEHLADRIAAISLRDKRVRRAQVRVEKLEAMYDADGAGVEVVRLSTHKLPSE